MSRVDADASKKVVLVGLEKSGKSSFLLRLVHNCFIQIYRKTIGVDFRMKKIEVNGKKEFVFPIWDLAGNQNVKSAISIYFGNAALIVFFIDLERIDLSINYISDWNECIEKYGEEDTKFAVVFTKSDLIEEQNMPSQEELQSYTQRAFAATQISEEQILTRKYFITSAKNSTGIEEAFQYWGECLVPITVPQLLLPTKDGIFSSWLGTSSKNEGKDNEPEPLVTDFTF